VSESDCVFCKIVSGEMESEVVHDEEGVLAFWNITPKTPVHVLVVPKEHVPSMEEVGRLSDATVRCIFEVAHEAAKKLGVAESGYVVRINNGPHAGQEVFHLHAPVMGGERMEMS